MRVPKYLYHATSKTAWLSIDRNGLIPAFPAVYMTDDKAVLPKFGEVYLKIETKHLDKELLGTYRERLCDIYKTTDFWHYYNRIPRKAITRI